MSIDVSHIGDKIAYHQALGDAMAKMKKQRDALADEIQQAMGDNGIGDIDGTPVITYQPSKRTALSQTVLKRDYPEVYDSCMVTTEVRSLKHIKPKGE